MEAKHHISYTIDKSDERIGNILNANDIDFPYKPGQSTSREKLTYTNGYYVNVTALFIDIVDSSGMAFNDRSILATIYRSFISECTAIMDSFESCKEINIHGDCVWGIFDDFECRNTEGTTNDAFVAAILLSNLICRLNREFRKREYPQISVGMGMDHGSALMIKAGYDGSGLNDVIWMGDVVNCASHLSKKAGRGKYTSLIVTHEVHKRLNPYYQKILRPLNIPIVGNTCYQAVSCFSNVFCNLEMQEVAR